MTRALAWLTALAAAALVLLVGCGGELENPAPPLSPRSPDLVTLPAAPADYELTVPRLRLAGAPLVEVGRNPDGTVEVPPLSRLDEVGVYRDGPMPGERGPAVLLGHVNGGGRPGPFARLSTLVVGDEVTVGTPRGEVRFRVTATQRVDKEAFPTARVYGDTDGPELRLITCGGDLDASGRNYRGQVIVYARAEG